MKNNAKKRRLYEAFIETLPLLTSLEVVGSLLFFWCLLADVNLWFTWSLIFSRPPAALGEDEGRRRHILQDLQRFAADHRSGDESSLKRAAGQLALALAGLATSQWRESPVCVCRGIWPTASTSWSLVTLESP